MSDGDKIDSGAWRAETQGTTEVIDAADMSRDAAKRWEYWDNKKYADDG